MFRTVFTRSSTLLNNKTAFVASGKRFYADAVKSEDLLTFSLVLPHQTIYKDKKAPLITLPGAKGVFGVAKDHIPKIAELKPGVMQINHEDGKEEKFFLSGGFAFINPDNTCYVNAIEAFPIEQLDQEAVKKGLAQYTQAYNDATEETAKAVALIGLESYQQMAYACGVSV
ncbi:hypothetical protein CYY_005719 [Polysphondylium violaceum]|uniref:ATP synthase F1 complex delta/epsilon subunit N-terminal domain-containing protein n=1 Tax=Polysphondylium violaceum TaxID=133409 RepID=A0A8J4PUM8_9MYCE|nr:hypothetical protein CYY_005719 [Polysphondylium violaceum]